MNKKKAKKLVDNIEHIFRNLTRDNLTRDNIVRDCIRGAQSMRDLRKELKIGEYEDPIETMSREMLATLTALNHDDRMKITDPTPEEPPKYGKVGAFFLMAAGVFLLICLVPWKKALPMIAKGWRYMWAGGHVEMPDTKDHFKED